MKQFNPSKIFLLCTALLGLVLHTQAQLDSCNVFMQGSHIEIGINFNGAYGSSVHPNIIGYCGTGYHPTGGIGTVSNRNITGCPSTTCPPAPTQGLGFVADPDKDGWTVGTPWTMIGDYFLPGYPQEGWAIRTDGVQVENFNGPGACSGSISAIYGTGSGSNLSYTTAGRFITSVWQGTWHNLQITQTTLMDTTKVFFTVYVSLVNTSTTTTRTGVYYERTLDPDNTAVDPSGSYSTRNKIEYQLPNADGKVLVSATGLLNSTPIYKAYLGLGTLDCRAKCWIVPSGLLPSSADQNLDSIFNIYDGVGDTVNYIMGQGDTLINDCGIGLVFKLGDIKPQDSVNFAFAYILRQEDIDSAFLTTRTKWELKNVADSFPHSNGDTVSVCIGSKVPIHVLGGASDVTWTWLSPTGNLITDTSGPNAKVTIDTGTTVVWAIGSSPSCGIDTVVITMFPFNPPPPIVTSNAPLCIGDTLKLSAAGIPNSYFIWKGPNNFTSGNPYPYRYNIQPEDSGLYSVYDSILGCPPQVTSTNVLVDAVIAKISSAKPDACVGADFTAYFSGRTPDTNSHFKWDFDNTQPIAGGPGDSGRGPYTLRWDSIGTKYIKLKVQNWRCVSTTIDTVPIIFAPPVHFDLPNDACVNDSFSAFVSDYSLVGADSLEWDLHGGTVLRDGNQNLSGVMHGLYNSPGTKTVTLKIDYLLCVGAPYSASFNVHALPDAHIAPLAHDICEGDTITFTADANPNYRYNWQPSKQVHDTLPGENVANIFIPATGKIWVIVTDQYGCRNIDTMNVPAKVCCQVSFPSAFTPNGDGRNDYFKPITMGNHHVNYFRIVNRYGQVVFESNDEKRGWDGKLFGTPQDMDTYFWVFSYICNGRTIEEKGDVILVR
jgi:gliding motility-associated-like protein